ncbi:Uncharacterised protein [Corynebacterium ulcerans]|uniref:Transposase n=1 Tax=Corynebacterium ulcerans TaxID=65058 RepID=A0ABD7MTW2_CORUL|nr:Uncharacterised protein [Corynebacterium ulcerans]SQG51880.1 Uncharacterised protein [Corynebacterium ulcerans]
MMEKDLLTKYRQSFKKTPITNPDTKHHNNLLDRQFNPHCVVSSPPPGHRKFITCPSIFAGNKSKTPYDNHLVYRSDSTSVPTNSMNEKREENKGHNTPVTTLARHDA